MPCLKHTWAESKVQLGIQVEWGGPGDIYDEDDNSNKMAKRKLLENRNPVVTTAVCRGENRLEIVTSISVGVGVE